mgnify:CR=1 FL=1
MNHDSSRRRFLTIAVVATATAPLALRTLSAEAAAPAAAPAAAKPLPAFKKAATFFKRFRDLTAGGYYTTPEGMKAIGYVGNMPSGAFEGPPIEALKHVGLA